jgi:hypothetical protein
MRSPGWPGSRQADVRFEAHLDSAGHPDSDHSPLAAVRGHEKFERR